MEPGLDLMEIVFGWLILPGAAFQAVVALATVWVESALHAAFGSRRPQTFSHFLMHWFKIFFKRPPRLKLDPSIIPDLLTFLAAGGLGMAFFSRRGVPGDLLFISVVLSQSLIRERPLSFHRLFPAGLLTLGFSVPGIIPRAGFGLVDSLQYQTNYGPLIGTASGALAALSAWIVLAFHFSRTGDVPVFTSGPVSAVKTLAFYMRRSGLILLWVACFTGGSWHGWSGARMIATWIALVFSLALVGLVPPPPERSLRRLDRLVFASVAAAVILAWGGRGL
jgi:hypothetical protein